MTVTPKAPWLTGHLRRDAGDFLSQMDIAKISRGRKTVERLHEMGGLLLARIFSHPEMTWSSILVFGYDLFRKGEGDTQ